MPWRLEPLEAVVQVPYHFRCPISLELMRDPVTVSTGQTYDRSSIESWIGTGNTTCPVTRVPMTGFNLIPNHTLRRLIQEWCVANRSFGVERIPTPKQPADLNLVRTLLTQASCGSASVSLRVSALRKLKGLARESEKNRDALISSNAREILQSVAFHDLSGDGSSELIIESIAFLSMFSLSDEDCVNVVEDPNRIGYLVKLLFHSSIDVRLNSAAVIENVVAGVRSPELRCKISGTERIFDGIVGILNLPLPYPRALKIGIKALFALCLTKPHRHRAVSAGAVKALIDKLPECEKCDAERALATVELLSRIQSGCAAFVSNALTVPILVKIILKISDRATEYAAGALLSLCSVSERAKRDAAACGVLTQLLLLVQSDCTERAKRKAQMLLKLLRDSWPSESIESEYEFLRSDVVLF